MAVATPQGPRVAVRTRGPGRGHEGREAGAARGHGGALRRPADGCSVQGRAALSQNGTTVQGGDSAGSQNGSRRMDMMMEVTWM